MHKVNIICLKWGSKYCANYVNRLYGMINRNLTLPFKFVCFTDNINNIRHEVTTQDLPQLDLPDNIPERGWHKLTVFAKDFGGLAGKTLFLDLDVVIIDNIDDFFTKPGNFLITRDTKHGKLEGNSSVFRFNIGQYPEILSDFKQNFNNIKNKFRHEQAYLSAKIQKLGELNFWHDDWVPSFKYHCCPSWIKSWFQTPAIPKNAKIILFHGLPNPPEAIQGISGKWYRHIQPSPWIKNYWVE